MERAMEAIEVAMEARLEEEGHQEGTKSATTATAVVTPADSVQEMNSRPVLPCVQDFQPGCLGPAWLAAPRDVPPRSDLASDWSMSVILASDWSECCSLCSWSKYLPLQLKY